MNYKPYLRLAIHRLVEAQRHITSPDFENNGVMKYVVAGNISTTINILREVAREDPPQQQEQGCVLGWVYDEDGNAQEVRDRGTLERMADEDGI